MIRSLPLLVVTILSLGTAIASWRFFSLGLVDAFEEMAPHIDGARFAFLAHVSAAPVALALVGFQLAPRLRARRRALHRWTGRVYATAILVSSVGALGMLSTANGGLPSQIGFGLLALLWLGTTANGVRLARARRFAEHRRWMIRSAALTLAALTLRIYLPFMLVSGMSYEQAIPILAFLCWVPNLVLAELWLAHRPALPVAA